MSNVPITKLIQHVLLHKGTACIMFNLPAWNTSNLYLCAHFFTFARHVSGWNCIDIHMQVHHTTKRQIALVAGFVYITGPDLVNVTVAFIGRHPTEEP